MRMLQRELSPCSVKWVLFTLVLSCQQNDLIVDATFDFCCKNLINSLSHFSQFGSLKVSNAQQFCPQDDYMTSNGNNFLIKIIFLSKYATQFPCSLDTGMKQCITHCIGLIEPSDNSSIGSQTPCYYDGVTGKCMFNDLRVLGEFILKSVCKNRYQICIKSSIFL
jgi:hypothetical protein